MKNSLLKKLIFSILVQMTLNGLLVVPVMAIKGPNAELEQCFKKRLYQVAIHESGHALAALFLTLFWDVEFIELYPSAIKKLCKEGVCKERAGYAQYTLKKKVVIDTSYQSYMARIQFFLGGKAAEEIMFGKSDGVGLHNDLRKARECARWAVKLWVDSEHTFSEADYEEQIESILEEQVAIVRVFFLQKADLLDSLAKTLCTQQRLETDQINQLLGLDD